MGGVRGMRNSTVANRRRTRVVEAAMEVTAAAHELWCAAVASGDIVQIEDANAVRDLTDLAIVVSRRIAGRAERIAETGDAHDTLLCGWAA